MLVRSEDCGLCASANGADPHRLVYENQHAASLIIFNPVNATHQIVVPKTHKTGLNQFTPEEAKGIMDLQYQVQMRLFALYGENFPPVISMQCGKLSTEPHLHWQVYSSGAHIRQLYARAHEVADTAIGAKAIGWVDKRTHPVIPSTEEDNPRKHENLEMFLRHMAGHLRGTGDLEEDRKALTELTHELLTYNGFTPE